jgi:uncharacterized protein YjaG (DUF416 family)
MFAWLLVPRAARRENHAADRSTWHIPAEAFLTGYDESEVRARLARVARAERTAFAAACAERLYPLYERYALAVEGGAPYVLRAVLNKAWDVARGAPARDADVLQAQRDAESMVPDESEEWDLRLAYAQNAVAAAAYAVRTWLSDDPQEAVWAARQVYDAADLAASPDSEVTTPEVEQAIFDSTVVQDAHMGVAADLNAIESRAVDMEALRARARNEGAVWARGLP